MGFNKKKQSGICKSVISLLVKAILSLMFISCRAVNGLFREEAGMCFVEKIQEILI
jgi:uncharacterized membrane protein